MRSVIASPCRGRRAQIIPRAFVRLRQMLASHADLARKLEAMEKKYDAQFKLVFDAIKELMKRSEEPKGQIGFRAA